jgi:hypothetical protein
MRAAIIGAAIAAVSLSACATKRYPIATKLGPAEQSAMTCQDLELELARAEMVRQRISDTAETDWRSIAGFIGDAGIGNALAKKDAEKAINVRVASIHAAQAAKHCSGAPSASLEEKTSPPVRPGAA